ncbi:MAG: hypothetical protein K8R59_18775 [Thermoanaerobaculales bacterium]|nr:hypothetical protein [Thermoanaerobaculales bacterium]
MKIRVLRLTLAIALLAGAGVSEAEFRVSDLIYVPVVAHTEGADDSVWRSDVIITNVEAEDFIDVALVLLPSGVRDNSSVFYDREDFLGGRAEDAFGTIDERLADIPPGGTVVLEDIVGEYWPDHSGLSGQGALVIYSYLPGSLDELGNREYRNMTVTARTYNTATFWEPDPDNEGEFLEKTGSYSQTMAGVPWYNLADAAFVDEDTGVDFSYLLLDCGRQDEDFRYNLGILNTSDFQTTITLKIEVFQADGTPFLDDEGNPEVFFPLLPPLAHVQYYQFLDTVFGLTDVSQVRFKVSFESWVTTGIDPFPTFTAYGSLIDRSSNDPSTIEPTFGTPYNVECMWPSTGGDAKAYEIEARSRNLSIPRR